MNSTLLASSLLIAAAAATGCAISPDAPPTQQQVVDSMIAQYAKEATLELRKLSENTGATRTEQTMSAKPQAPATMNPAGSTIAGKMGSIAVESSANGPTQATFSQPGQQAAPTAATPQNVRSEPLPSALEVPSGLEKKLTLIWTGDLESLIFIIGKETGWKVLEPTGLRVQPVIIAMNAKDRPAFEVLRDVGAIAGEAADVVVSIPNKTLTVAYRKR